MIAPAIGFTPDAIDSLARADFYMVVDDDLHDRLSPEDTVALRQSKSIQRWRVALCGTKIKIQQKLTAKATNLVVFRAKLDEEGPPDAESQWRQARVAFLEWRGRTTTILGRVEMRLAETTVLLQTSYKSRYSARELVEWAARLIPADHEWHKARAERE